MGSDEKTEEHDHKGHHDGHHYLQQDNLRLKRTFLMGVGCFFSIELCESRDDNITNAVSR